MYPVFLIWSHIKPPLNKLDKCVIFRLNLNQDFPLLIKTLDLFYGKKYEIVASRRQACNSSGWAYQFQIVDHIKRMIFGVKPEQTWFFSDGCSFIRLTLDLNLNHQIHLVPQIARAPQQIQVLILSEFCFFKWGRGQAPTWFKKMRLAPCINIFVVKYCCYKFIAFCSSTVADML